LSYIAAVNKNIYQQGKMLLTAEITIQSTKELLDNEALNKQIMFQYLSINFDGKRGLLNDVFRNILEQPIGCSKQLLQQQFPTIKISK
jgi:hypothetical protein